VVSSAFSSAGVPVVKEPAGLCRADGKRMSLIPWKAGKPAVCDVAATCTPASSTREADAAAETEAIRGRRPNTVIICHLSTRFIQ